MIFRVCTILILFFLLSGCVTQRASRELIAVENAKNIEAKYLKVHLKDGFLYLLNTWSIDSQAKTIKGNGNYYDFNRKFLKLGDFTIPFDRVTILETNDKSNNPGVATMIILGIATVPFSIYCLANPKACFGSCPTYYVKQDSAKANLVGEGFSSSICRVMEERDVDIIDLPFQQNQPAQIIVKNEALETHLIRNINLLEIKKLPGERVFHGLNDSFYRITNSQTPVRAEYNSKSVLDQLFAKDHNEWYSLADSIDLLTKEDIFLEFNNYGKESGLLIDKRQSLLTTYLFYNSLSLMGDATGFYLAEVDNGNEWLKERLEKFYNILGGIEVSILSSKNKWETVETVREAGPIASDMHLIKLPEIQSEKRKIRLRMTKGLWRIDLVNLVDIVSEVTPKRILPQEVFKGGERDTVALNKLLNKNNYLVTYPGDVFTLHYAVNFLSDHEYFIDSQGYYIEWMREEWLQYQNMKLARKMLLNPSKYLKQIAPAYKKVEPEMESIFWNSRYPNNHEK